MSIFKISKKKIFFAILLLPIVFLTVHLVYAAYTYNVKRELGATTGVITEADAPKFTGTMQIGKAATTGYLYLYPNDSPPTCDSNAEGTIYADDSENRLKLCNGSDWVLMEY